MESFENYLERFLLSFKKIVDYMSDVTYNIIVRNCSGVLALIGIYACLISCVIDVSIFSFEK
jgi:hypothetical protein